jgi:hypothetical protein
MQAEDDHAVVAAARTAAPIRAGNLMSTLSSPSKPVFDSRPTGTAAPVKSVTPIHANELLPFSFVEGMWNPFMTAYAAYHGDTRRKQYRLPEAGRHSFWHAQKRPNMASLFKACDDELINFSIKQLCRKSNAMQNGVTDIELSRHLKDVEPGTNKMACEDLIHAGHRARLNGREKLLDNFGMVNRQHTLYLLGFAIFTLAQVRELLEQELSNLHKPLDAHTSFLVRLVCGTFGCESYPRESNGG